MTEEDYYLTSIDDYQVVINRKEKPKVDFKNLSKSKLNQLTDVEIIEQSGLYLAGCDTRRERIESYYDFFAERCYRWFVKNQENFVYISFGNVYQIPDYINHIDLTISVVRFYLKNFCSISSKELIYKQYPDFGNDGTIKIKNMEEVYIGNNYILSMIELLETFQGKNKDIPKLVSFLNNNLDKFPEN